jgi:hypothetical protein
MSSHSSLPIPKGPELIPADLIAKSQSLSSDPFRKSSLKRAPLLASLSL